MKREIPPSEPTPDTALSAAPDQLDTPVQASPLWAAADLLRGSIADNTRRSYDAALRKFEQSGFPETDAGVARYLVHLYEQGRSPACGALVVAALRFRAKLSGRPSPLGATALRVLAGFRRKAAGRGRGKVAGVGWEEADRAAELSEETGEVRGLRDAAIVAVASDALLRVSEIAALDVADVNLDQQTVVIRRSKTDQEQEGSVQFLGKPTVERIRAWLQAAGLTEGALFRALTRSGRVYGERLSPRSMRSVITRRARAAGVEGRVSGHSLRVGSAQSLATSGASLVEMQVAGRWESPNMPGHYAQGQLASQGAVAKLRYGTNWTLPDLPAP